MRTLALALVFGGLATGVFANPKGESLILKIDGLKPPVFDQTRRSDKTYIASYQSDYQAFQKQKNDLILDLYKADPENPKTADLMAERWSRFSAPTTDVKAYFAAIDADIKAVLDTNPPAPVREAAAYVTVMNEAYSQREKFLPDTEAFIVKYPKSKWGAQLLMQGSFSADKDNKPKIYRELVAKYPDSKEAGMAKGALAQYDSVGKPFALTFNEAVTGKPVDVSALKGKVVLVDFWATWCGPCVAEMPHVKEIYNQYHSKGLEIVGVSLDNPESEGGLTKLKDYVAKNQIPWPMYYQGNGWDSKFSTSWGIMSIPSMFVVDKQGNFQGTIEPRNADFETQLKKYLGQ